MKSLDDRGDDFKAVFESIKSRINIQRAKEHGHKEYPLDNCPCQITTLDTELGKAVKDYCAQYRDEIILGKEA